MVSRRIRQRDAARRGVRLLLDAGGQVKRPPMETRRPEWWELLALLLAMAAVGYAFVWVLRVTGEGRY